MSLIEAKRDLADDFLIRQLYYPYRVWKKRIAKEIQPVFLIYSNGIFHLYEYKFQNPDSYNSLILVKQKNYTVEETGITVADIQGVLNTVNIVKEPETAFPQADKFERIINLCELLDEQELSAEKITERYAFDARQTNYYTDAARYLGLVEKQRKDDAVFYSLSEKGKQILNLKFKQRQLEYCRLILSHQVFSLILCQYLKRGKMPDKAAIIWAMKDSKLYNIGSDYTFERRSSTIKGWINWIIGLTNPKNA